MVIGLDKFREAFANFKDNYVIIGGTACDIVLSDTDMRPRATNDIDMILVVENMTKEYGDAFWQFIKDGEYKAGKREKDDKTPTYTLYRFTTEKTGYPVQIELLSRHSNVLGEPSGFRIEPIPLSEDLSSLSAIMMDDENYELTVANSEEQDGLRIATPAALICLKARAYLNLLQDKANGKQVNTKDIKKHKTDVLKLIATASIPEPIAVSQYVYDSVMEYVSAIEKELPSQSLQDALDRDAEAIQAYLDALKSTFIVK
ncbi:MAG: hypothetical protein E7069_03795 [Bacteroidales bacterium]|nr:hypothetical protein [Bacteroidales bacterium]